MEKGLTRLMSGEVARVVAASLISPKVYASVGLDPALAVRQVRDSEHRKDVMQRSARRLTDFLDDIGVLRGPGRALWRSSGLLG